MSDRDTIDPPNEKKRGKGSGKPPPSFVLNSSNYDEWVQRGPAPAPKRLRRARYNKKLGDEICAELRLGKTLRSACHERGIWPDVVLEWADTNPVFARQYARDLQFGFDILGQQVRDAAHATHLKPEDVPLARHRFDVDRWYLGKRAPKRWGDKVQAEISGPDGAPVSMQLDVMLQAVLTKPEVLARLSDVQLEALQSAIPLLVAPTAASDGAALVDAEYSVVEAGATKGD